MNIGDIANIKDWLMDGHTTEVFANRVSLAYTVEALCKQYVALHGNHPKVILDVCGVLDELHKKVWESKMDKGFPDFNKRRG
jgi:hypothetical protein